MFKYLTIKIKLNVRLKKYITYINALLTRKRLQLRDITLIIIITKYHLFIICIRNVENLQ